ncbi:calphotin-like [Notolabrus celidotus]|uniref:calphotin-like n=1 Tax=Notolabrus celidotus TaxID=1203425 RepID=UPI00149000A5|nr:calphotin-like [Notolabrus celidotus]
MPSKRKKNKRRMRRVQAQRRALEEQHAANPPAKASPGIAVCAPPCSSSKESGETSTCTYSTSTRRASVVEAEIVPEAEPIIPETEPVAEITPLPAAPVEAPVETEILTEETTIVTTETEQTLIVCEPDIEVVAEVVAEEVAVIETEVEAAVITEEIPVPEPVAEEIPVPEPVTEEPEVEAAPVVADKEVTEAVVETVEEIIEVTPAPVEIAVCTEAPPEDDVEVLAEEEAPEVPEPVAITEDAPAPAVEIPVVADTLPEAPVEAVEAAVSEIVEALPATQEIPESFVDDFVVTESASAVEVAIAESAAVEPEIVEVTETPIIQSETLEVAPPEPEPIVAPAEEIIIDATLGQKCLDVMSEEFKTEICDMPCQMQAAVESVQLKSTEMTVDAPAPLNGHIAPEVSIEG